MSRTVTVEVTAEDIAAGERDSCERCPIAIAVQRTGLIRVHADADAIWGWPDDGDDTESIGCDTPDIAARFMEDFDTGEPVEPFAFTVELS